MQDRQPHVSCTSLAEWDRTVMSQQEVGKRALEAQFSSQQSSEKTWCRKCRGIQKRASVKCFPFPPSQTSVMRASTSQPHPSPFPSQALFVEPTWWGLASHSECSCCLSSFILRHSRSEVCFCQCWMKALFTAVTDKKSVFFCVPVGEV